jgi:hypothetical protein
MYKVQFYHGRARECQIHANMDNCIAYLQAHFSISENPKDNYASVAIGSNASPITKRWAKYYIKLIQDDFGITLGGNEGVLIGGTNGENELDLIYSNMPAILVKPLFATNPLQAEWIKTKSVQARLAKSLVRSIQNIFPDGGLIGFRLSREHFQSDQKDEPLDGTNAEKYSDIVLWQTGIMLQSNELPLSLADSQESRIVIEE